MDTTMLHHVNEGIAAYLTEASRGDLARLSGKGRSGLELYEHLLSEHRRLIAVISGGDVRARHSCDIEESDAPAVDVEGYGEYLAARFRQSARSLEASFATGVHADPNSLYAEHAMEAMAVARHLSMLLGCE